MESLTQTLKTLIRLLRRMLGYSTIPHQFASHSPNAQTLNRCEQTVTDHALHGEALALTNQLKGKTLHIPDLMKVFSDWPLKENKHVKELESLVNAILEKHITNPKKLKALKAADFARLIALWYPDAEWAELETATAYSVWIFVWDDEIDVGDTEVANDEELVRAYYQQSLNFIHSQLGLDADNEKAEEPHPNMVLFGDVGPGLRAATDGIQRQRFYRELENFMVQVGIEHTHRLRGIIPTVDGYMHIRSGSVGCAPQIALTDYMLKMRMPESVMESEAMKGLWRETVVICLILNDIYSCQKELAQGSPLNLVPVLFWNAAPEDKNNLDTVTSAFMTALEGSMQKFEEAAKSLEEMSAGDEQLTNDTRGFVKWCRYFITGVLAWSLESRRYGMAQCLNEDGSLDVVF